MAQNGRPKDAWRGASGGSAKPARGPKGPGARRWVIAAFVVAALAGGIAGLFVYLKPDPEPVVLVIPVTQYKHADWPANPLAESDARAFFEAFPGRTAPAFPDQEQSRILAALTQMISESKTTATSRPILVYLNALGLAINGEPYILPGDADPADVSTWLSVDSVLSVLSKGTVSRVLILDIRPVSSIRAGLATCDWNEALQSKLNAAAPPKDLWILSASNPANGPTLLRPVRQSVFGLAISQGIGGRADGWNAEKHTNAKVSFQEFACYTQQATLLGTRNHGGGEQLPALFGSGADFPLVSFPEGKPKALPDPVDGDAYPDWLKASWNERDLWIGSRLHRRAPRLLNHQSLVALRAEDAWRAGMDPTANKDRHESTLKKLSEAAKQFPLPVAPKKSIGRWSASPEAAAQESAAVVVLRPFLTKIQSDEPLKKEDWQPTLLAVRGTLDAKVSEIPPEAVQAAVFATLLGLKTPTHDQHVRAAALLATLPSASKLAETIAIQWIASLPPEQVKEWEKAAPGTLLSLLQLTKATEQALAFDGRAFPWLNTELDRLDKARRTALALLGSLESGVEDFRAAKEAVDSARKDYDKVRGAAALLAERLGEIEEGHAVLADLAAAYPHKLAPAPGAVASDWAGLVEQYRKITVLLRPQTTPGLPKLDDLDVAVRTFSVRRNNLLNLRIGPEDTDPKRLELALRWPWLKAGEREKLLARHAEASQAAAKRVLDRWSTKPETDTTQAAPGVTVREETIRDLRIAVDLLAMANLPEIGKLQAQAKGLDPKNELGMMTLNSEVRYAARKTLPAQFKAADVPGRSEIGWAVNPDDLPAVPLDAGMANPEPALRKQREIDYSRWLKRRYGLEAEALRAVKNKASTDAAEDLDGIANVYWNWNP